MTTEATNTTAASSPLERRVRPPARADLARLERMLGRLDAQELRMMKLYGREALPGTMRAIARADAQALRALLVFHGALSGCVRPNV